MTTIYKTNVTAANYTLGTSLGYNGTYTTAATISSNALVGDGVLKINGNPASLEVKGTVVINGLDLEERLKTIENLLLIPERDAILEAKYPSLKKKYDEYIKSLEKYRMWETIKGNDND
jgi:hypothetical protein